MPPADPNQTVPVGPAEPAAGAADEPSAIGKVGPYIVLQEVGRGSQGVVYRAVQASTRRPIALKVVLSGLFANPRAKDRFEREVDAVAALNHPNIITVYAVDEVDGRSLLAMEWVDGVPVDDWARGLQATPRPIREILGLMIRICDAVHYAHQRGVIHRDLKPTNILVDSANEPHLLDFGLAKIATQEKTLTLSEEFVGTPAYAAPEQFLGDPGAIDVRTDVYALGVMLCEMLTGDLPYELGQSLVEWIEAIREKPPQRPSLRNPRVDRELDIIALKALEKDKSRRYQSVEALAADLRRYLAGEPILAHAPSAAYQLRKLIRRHWLPFSLAMSVLVISVAFAIVATLQARQEHRLRQEADDQAKEALRQKEEAVASLRGFEREAYRGALYGADAALRARDPAGARRMLDRWQQKAPHELKNWEWGHLARRLDYADDPSSPAPVAVLTHNVTPRGLAVSPDAATVFVALGDGGALAIDTESRTPRGVALQTGNACEAVHISSDGERLAAICDGQAREWDVESTCEISRSGPANSAVSAITFAPDGALIVAARDGKVQWISREGAIVRECSTDDGPVIALCVDDDGRLLAGSASGHLTGWNTSAAAPRFSLRIGKSVAALALQPGATLLACATGEPSVLLLDALSGATLAELGGHDAAVTALAFNPDGSRLVSGDADGAIRIWSSASREEVFTLHGHSGRIRALAFTPDNARLISAADDGEVRVWEARSSAPELVRLMLAGLGAPQEVLESLQADDALDPSLRAAAIRIVRRMIASAYKHEE